MDKPFLNTNGVDWYEMPISDTGRDTNNLSNDIFRIIGGENKEDANIALSDFYKTGAIRGSQSFNGEAYFNHNAPDYSYYWHNGKTINQREKLISAYGKDKVIPYNYVIQGNEDFFTPISQNNNPLYHRIYSTVGDSKLPSGNSKTLGSRYWVVSPNESTTVNETDLQSFSDIINPNNRKGLKITGGYTGDIKLNYPEGSTPPSNYPQAKITTNIKPQSKIVYDRITPFLERPISTHLSNANVEGNIFLNAAKTRPLSTNPLSLGSMSGISGAAKATALTAGAIMTPIQIGMQINALNKSNIMDREYGDSDPLSIRPMYDFALSKIMNGQKYSDSWKAMNDRVSDPEFQMRNPISSVPYNLIHGNIEPLKAFAQGYVPAFLK